VSDGRKKMKYIEMFNSFTEPFNCVCAPAPGKHCSVIGCHVANSVLSHMVAMWLSTLLY